MLFEKKTYTDKELVQGCIRNNRRHQERLYKRYFAMSMSIVFQRISNEEEAVAIVNQGFLRVFQNMEQLQDIQALGGWIKTIMLRTCADEYKKQHKYNQTIVLDIPTLEKGKEETMQQIYFKDIIHLLEHLPPASAEVFQLYAVEGFKHREIAAQLGISEGTSKWHLSAARERLKQLLQEHYYTKKDVG